MELISITEIQGYDSISASRLTINDNFSIVSDAVNGVLTLFDTSTGAIDLTALGTGSISAKTLTLSTSAVLNGTLNVVGTASFTNASSSGTLTVNNILFGNASAKILSEQKTSGGSTLVGANLYGATAISTKSTGTFDFMVIPKVNNIGDLTSMVNPHVGSAAYVIGATSLALCIATGTGAGATGTWMKLSLESF